MSSSYWTLFACLRIVAPESPKVTLPIFAWNVKLSPENTRLLVQLFFEHCSKGFPLAIHAKHHHGQQTNSCGVWCKPEEGDVSSMLISLKGGEPANKTLDYTESKSSSVFGPDQTYTNTMIEN